MSIDTILYAFFGGLLPAIIWLYFLLKEDSRCPEPPRMIWLTFILGMLVVPLVLFPERWAEAHFASGLSLWTAWAAIEETLKYAVVALFIFPRRAVDETPDYVIYMVTIALGFAAAENALFLFAPLSTGDFLGGVVTDNMRFIGATLLHVIASSAIGFTLAFSYQKTPIVRTLLASLGLILAVLLHTTFNALIIVGSGRQTLSAFLLVWSAAVVFFALFEILKYFRYRRLAKNTC
ncbi:MAG: PrsW family glutamic-type intramembrane protease [bacterium]|nr:PrsW family glutamic-type intramembrane protease [bacterium]